MAGLKALGYAVTFTSSTLSSTNAWDSSSVEGLKALGVHDVHVYEATAADEEFLALLNQFTSTRRKLLHPRGSIYLLRRLLRYAPTLAALLREAGAGGPINSLRYTPPAMRRWFGKVLEDAQPRVIVMNYAHWDGLLDHKKLAPVVRIIDTLDLVSINARMQQLVVPYLPAPLAAELTPDEILDEKFFEKLGVRVPEEEFRIFDSYDHTIAISSKEAELIKRHTHRTKVSWLPVTFEPRYISNTYAGSPLFAVGPNLFNLQGYLYFAKKVLPAVRRSIPSFSLRVTGSFYNHAPPSPSDGIILGGFVPDLKIIYETAGFFVCPVFGGTGQQIKIVEAMAHGLPVVALRFAAERSPIKHEVNGLVADDAPEFAAHVVRLWNDPALRRRMGEAARETIAQEASHTRTIETLASMLDH
ncbi:MAG: hypothetical protein QOE33_2470 [Acidobacteriota bacterium]|nr:hypothetical protein [Acidobacteriota bacterium]